MPGFLSSRPNWVPPPVHPLTRKGVLLLSPLGPRGGIHSLSGEGVGGLSSDEGTTSWYPIYPITVILLRVVGPSEWNDYIKQSPIPLNMISITSMSSLIMESFVVRGNTTRKNILSYSQLNESDGFKGRLFSEELWQETKPWLKSTYLQGEEVTS